MGPKGWLGYVCVCAVSSWSDTGLTKIGNKGKKYLVALQVIIKEQDFDISQQDLNPIKILQMSVIVRIYGVLNPKTLETYCMFEKTYTLLLLLAYSYLPSMKNT